MAWNVTGPTTTVGPYKEIFKFPPNSQGFASVVLDATAVAAAGDGRRILKAGTILAKNATSNQYERYKATAGQTVKGVLAVDVEFVDGTSKSDQPAPMAFHGEVFLAERIIDLTTYSTAAKAAMPTCRFD